jgi:hypothetical protein
LVTNFRPRIIVLPCQDLTDFVFELQHAFLRWADTWIETAVLSVVVWTKCITKEVKTVLPDIAE